MIKNVTTLQGLLNTNVSQIDQLQPSDLQAAAYLAPTIADFRTFR